ncbi:MAG: hypothetical protein H7837_03610 [Magnetococcus sp. MYC-9]
MNTIPRKFLLILTDLGLSLLFLVIILVAALDFNSRLKHEEQQARQGGGARAGHLAQLQKQKESLSSQVDKNRAELQELWDKNSLLTAELRKKNAEARKLLEDNVALLSQNASLLVRLNQEESRTTPPPPMAGDGGKPSAEEAPQAQRLRQENAALTDQLAQMNATLQKLQQQKTAQTAPPPDNAPRTASPPREGAAAERSEPGFWDKMVVTFQDAPHTESPPTAPARKGGEGTPTAEPDSSATRATAVGKADKTSPPSVAAQGERGTAPPTPVVTVEKGMLPPAALDKVVSSFQAAAPSVPAAPAGTVPPPAAAGSTPRPPPPTVAATAATHGTAPTTPAGAGQTAPSENGAQAAAEAGFWNTLLNSFQEPSKTPAVTTTVALAPPPPPTAQMATVKTPPARSETVAPEAKPEAQKPVTPQKSAATVTAPAPKPEPATTTTAPTPARPPVPVAAATHALPAEQAKVELKSVGERPQTPPLSQQEILNIRNQLLRQVQNDLKQHQIPAEVNEQAGTLYLPGLLEFKQENPTIGPEQRQGMRTLATVLAKRLPCYTQQMGQGSGCAEGPSPVKLDALVIVGNSGSAPVGSSAFRHNWNQANARALQTFATLLEAHPQLNEMRNGHEQSLFHLDGFLPPESTAPGKPLRRVELRFVMSQSPQESRSNR